MGTPFRVVRDSLFIVLHFVLEKGGEGAVIRIVFIRGVIFYSVKCVETVCLWYCVMVCCISNKKYLCLFLEIEVWETAQRGRIWSMNLAHIELYYYDTLCGQLNHLSVGIILARSEHLYRRSLLSSIA